MSNSKHTLSIEYFGDQDGVFWCSILVIILSAIWWNDDSKVFYQWSVVGLTTLYTFSFHNVSPRLCQTISDTGTHLQIEQRRELPIMASVLFVIIAYNSWNLNEFSPVWGSFCALLLTSVLLRPFVSNTITLDKTKTYGFFVEKGIHPNDDNEYTLLECNEGQWKRLGIMYSSLSLKEEKYWLVKQGVKTLHGECIQKGNIFSNLRTAAFYIFFAYLVLHYLPQITRYIFPVGFDEVKGLTVYRTKSEQDMAVGISFLLSAIPSAFFLLIEAFICLRLVSLGGRQLILFLNKQVILTNGSGRRGTNKSLSFTTIQSIIICPNKEGKENTDIDERVKLTDVKGEFVSLSEWHFGAREVLNHLATLGVPVINEENKAP